MASPQLHQFFQHIGRAGHAQDGQAPTDGALLEAFIADGDEAAFAALVRRHGPMVLGVCRRVLGSVHDAEDAFQAAFLVLARKAASVRPRELVGNWLYGVAYRTALEARGVLARRGARERQVTNMPEPAAAPREVWLELQPLLDQELGRLPDKYRAAVVLCELEGRSRKEVARQLGIPEGTLSSRLAAARKLLAGRLARRGLALSAEALAILLAQNGASAAVPAALALSTVRAATLIAAGESAAAGLVSTQAAALAKGVMKSMFLTKLKLATVAFLTVGLVGLGGGTLVRQAGAVADDRPAAEKPVKEKGDKEDPNRTKPRDDKEDPNRNKPRDDKEDPNRNKGDKERGEKEDPNRKKGDKEDPNKGKGDKETGEKGRPAQETVTLTGTVEAKEMERKRDDGSVVKVTTYILTEKNGNKVQLPAPRRSEAGDLLDNYDLATFAGKEVVVTGRAFVVRKSEREDAPRQASKMVQITEIKLKK